MGNFYAQLDRVFTANQASDCFRLLDREDWSYGDLQGHVGRIAGVLKSQGVSVGDRVAVQVEKSPENLALYLATLRIGAIYLPLNTGYTSAELDYFIGDAEPALFVGARPRNLHLRRAEERTC